MTSVQRLTETPVAVVNADAGSIMAIIDRAARDPATDVDKLERLMNLYERISAQSAKAAYVSALAELQPLLPVITERGGIKDRNGKVQSTYALWEDINDAIRPLLAQHGFALSFRVGSEPDRITVTGVLSHREGHQEETTMSLPVDGSGSKNAVQAVGSSTSYGKRYTTQALLNLTSRGEDDDARLAGMGATLTPDQIMEVQELIDSVSADKPRFLAYMGADNVSGIMAKDFDKAVAALNAKARR